MWFDGAPGNPPVVFNDQIKPGDDLFLDLDSITQPVMSQFFGGSTEVLELTQDLTTAAWKCNKVQKHIVGAPDRTIVGTTGFSGQREYWIHTPSFQLLSNELHSPMLDGGKSAVELTANAGPRFRTSCSNAPRSFLNEDFCVLSMDACNDKSTSSEDVFIEISIENLKLINTLTSEISDPRFAYAVTDLRQSLEYDEPPCKPGAHSRWVPVDDCTGGTQVDAATKQVFADLITNTADKHNKNLRDVFFPQTARSCNSYDANAFDFKVQVGSTCWQNTHVDNWRVFDFSYWAVYHPGNSNARNPIKEFAELHKTFILKFPSWHGMDRWHQNKQFFPYVGRLGDITTLEDLPHNLYNDEIASAFGRDTSIATVGPTVVCGSPFEVASIHSPESGTYLRGGFDMVTRYNQTLNDPEFQEQRQTIWMEIALKSKDQLRQRVAWALSQIIVVSPGSIQSARNSEIFLAYYDIFVRNAFGNYFDILKEVTYSPMMAEMLSYLDGQSTGFAYIKEFRLQYADENFAREIMQLFSIGLNMLNSDGTLKLDDSGNPILTYTNEDITEYAKVYTGYNLQKSRGNVEDRTNPDWRDNQIDPAQINIVHRDHLPKVSLFLISGES